MSSEERKQIVAEGLERRKAERAEAEKEARLERYEMEQLQAVNANCADARMKRQAEQATRNTIQLAAQRRAERAKAMAMAQELEDKAMNAVRYYGAGCLSILWLCAVTKLPFWAAAALIAGLAVFPAVYVFRLYNPLEG